MGSAVSASVTIAVSMLLASSACLAPVRVILLPEEFENQLAGSAGATNVDQIPGGYFHHGSGERSAGGARWIS